jgi:septal ring factor EnvC (AmiA/AmiB activator)
MADDDPTIDLQMLGELIVGLRDELRADIRAINEKLAAHGEGMQTLIRMLRRIEDRIDRTDEQILSLMQSDQDLSRRLRAVERAREDTNGP